MEDYKPLFTITNQISTYVSSISEKIGRVTATSNLESKPHLRKNNRIKSIHSSLKIEANSLSLGQVRDVINGKTVLGEQKEIQEVINAYAAYEKISEIDPYSITDLKKLHSIMTKYVAEESDDFRLGEEGVFNDNHCIFMAPPARLVPQLMDYLFNWMKEAKIPLESQIVKFQDEYYDAVAKCHIDGASTIFIEFMLSQIDKIPDDISIQINRDNKQLSECIRKLLDVMEKLGLKSKEGFRRNYLRPEIDMNFFCMTIPDKPNSRNQS